MKWVSVIFLVGLLLVLIPEIGDAQYRFQPHSASIQTGTSVAQATQASSYFAQIPQTGASAAQITQASSYFAQVPQTSTYTAQILQISKRDQSDYTQYSQLVRYSSAQRSQDGDFQVVNRQFGNHYTNYRLSTVLSDTLIEESSEFPTPRSVLFKSLMIPGWGQIENKQIWKVPLIYGMFAGVGIYTSYLNNRYKDYRAAYYNTHQTEENDYKFGPTPDYLVGVNQNQLQSNRNSFRNQRDFMFIVMGLAYGLNALDAYIFAHMRSFDVSEDLSATTHIGPTILDGSNPGISVRINIY